MKHLFLAESDYAASGNMFSLALSSVGEEAVCLIARKHLFNYPQQGKVFHDVEVVREAIAWAEWVWIIQSDLPASMGGNPGHYDENRLQWLELLKGKRIGLLHGGGYFRDNRPFYKQLWSPYEPLSICYEADLMGSFENEHLLIPPVNLDHFTVRARTWGLLRIGHFPSRPTDKGSEWIVPMLTGTQNIEFFTNVHNPFSQEEGAYRLEWKDHLTRMSFCDVIVDQIKPELNGKPFGEWVSLATEAAALGKISIANSLNPKPYFDSYGRWPEIHICNTPEELAKEIERIKILPDYELDREQKQLRQWVEDYHTLVPTGELLKKCMSTC